MKESRRLARACQARRHAGLLWVGCLVVLTIAAGARPACAANFQLAEQASVIAWSGFWWPMQTTQGPHLYDTTGPFQPLERYGEWTGDFRPLQWEQQYEKTSDPQATWYGHCHAWAAASLSEPEPKYSVKAPSTIFNIGDIKGLLTAAHDADPADYYAGARHDEGATIDTDLRAQDFHRAVLYYLVQRHEGLIFNLSPKAEVWSYPGDQVAMNAVTDAVHPEFTHVSATLSFPRDDVAADFHGVSRFTKTFSYWVKGDPQSVNGVTAAGWEGPSIQDHPQFVWHPAYPRSYWPDQQPPNPLDYSLVHRLAQVSTGQGAGNSH